MNHSKKKAALAAFMVAGLTFATAACSSSSNTGENSGSGDEPVEVTLLIDNAENQIKQTEAMIAAFEAKNENIKIKMESRPGGSEGDNIVKTRLSTGEMTDLFSYNAGSLFQQIQPENYVEPITGQGFLSNVSEAFKPVVSIGENIYGVPMAGTSQAGGIFYNIKLYEELGLTVPTTWAEFMANNEKAKAAGKTALLQTYGDTWSSQLFMLSDFHNVAATNPDFAEQYTNNQAKFATDPTAFRSIQKLEDVAKAGFFNEDFASAKFDPAVLALANGEAVHLPVLTGAMASIPADKIADVGFFATPGDDAATNGMTTWMSDGLYIDKNSENKEAALKFMEFVTTPEACDARAEAVGVTGPWQLTQCELPADAPRIVQDMNAYVQAGKESPALEYVSPIKGPNLEHLLIELGSGLADAKDVATRYDEDVKKQAKQLGIEGW